jgi:hypothetical protein
MWILHSEYEIPKFSVKAETVIKSQLSSASFETTQGYKPHCLEFNPEVYQMKIAGQPLVLKLGNVYVFTNNF